MINRQDKIERELARRRAVYETCKGRGLEHLQGARVDDALFWFSASAVVGWNYHFGRWSDHEIDRALVEIAATLCEKVSIKADARKRSGRLLHLTSSVIDGGGHTEVILAWCGLLQKYERAEQFVVSSEWINSLEHGRNNLSALSALVSGYNLCPQALRPVEKVRWLYQAMIEHEPETAILHVNPNDVLSLCAALMLRRRLGTRLVFFNHADHVFSLGLPLADRIIEYRPEGARYTVGHRGIEAERIARVPLGSRSRNSPKITRAELAIPENCTASITIAAYYKLVPDESWDFGKAIFELLSAEPNHYHMVVGHGARAIIRNVMSHFRTDDDAVSSRLVWLGRRTDIDALLNVADFLIESFPLAGGTVRTDAMRAGIPVVSITNTRWRLITETGALPEDYPLVAKSNDEVVRFSRLLISDAGLRARYGRQLLERYEKAFSEAAIISSLREALATGPTRRNFDALEQKPEYDLRYAVALGNRAINIHDIEDTVEAHMGFENRARMNGLSTRLAKAMSKWTRRARAKFYPPGQRLRSGLKVNLEKGVKSVK